MASLASLCMVLSSAKGRGHRLVWNVLLFPYCLLNAPYPMKIVLFRNTQVKTLLTHQVLETII